MRSRSHFIVTKDEVYGYANHWLDAGLKLEYQGVKCTATTVYQVLLIAAARVVSIFAACRDLADAPSDQTIRNALDASLPEIAELERRLNLSLVTKLPKALRRKKRMIAIDLTLIPYHGEPAQDKKEIYRGEPKSGTTHFHAYATAVVLHKGQRFTLALTRVEAGETMKDVVQRLLQIVRRRGVQIKFVLLDKGFFSVGVISYLKRAGYGFIIPAVSGISFQARSFAVIPGRTAASYVVPSRWYSFVTSSSHWGHTNIFTIQSTPQKSGTLSRTEIVFML